MDVLSELDLPFGEIHGWPLRTNGTGELLLDALPYESQEFNLHQERRILGFLVVALIVYLIGYLAKIRERKGQHVSDLGSTPYVAQSWAPLGLDLTYRLLKSLHASDFLGFTRKVLDVPGRTVQMNLLSIPVFLTDNPENVKAVLSSQFSDFGKGKVFEEIWENVMGHSIFNCDGAVWRNQKSLLRPLMAKTRPSDLAVVETHVQQLIKALSRDDPVAISDIMQRYAFDVVTDSFFGKSANSLETDQQPVMDAINKLTEWNTVRTFFGPLGQYTPGFLVRGSLNTLNRHLTRYVKKTFSISTGEAEAKPERDRTILEALALINPTAKDVNDHVLPIILAGKDPSAITLSWALYELSRNPVATKKLRSEIVSRIGCTKPPTADDLKQLPYLHNIVQEILRLYHPVGVNVRTALTTTTLPQGGGPCGTLPVTIFPGQQVIFNLLSLQRRHDLVGPDADRFRPERWDTYKPETWQYLPFSNGPRICLGRHFARLQMEYTLARLFQEFEFVTGDHCSTEKEVRIKVEMNTKPARGIVGMLHRGEC